MNEPGFARGDALRDLDRFTDGEMRRMARRGAKTIEREDFHPFCNPQIDISPKLNEQTGAVETPEPRLDPHTEAMARKAAASSVFIAEYPTSGEGESP